MSVSEAEKSPDNDLPPGLPEPENVGVDFEDLLEVRFKDTNYLYMHLCVYFFV